MTKYNNKFINNINCYILGRAISSFGTQIYNFILALYILKITGTALTFAITLVLSIIPRIILGPIAGILVDRLDRKKIIVITDILCGIIMLLLYLYMLNYNININVFYFVTILINSINVFFDIAMTAAITDMFSKEDLTKVSSMNQAITSITEISGPFLGGFIFGILDLKLFVLINGISFLISAFLEVNLDFKYRNVKKSINNLNLHKEILESIRYIYSEKIIFILYFSAIFINIFFSMGVTIPFPYIITNVFKLPAYQFGILQAMNPIGMLLGSVLLSMLPEKRKKYKYIIIGFFIESLCILLIGVPGLITYLNQNILLCFIFYIVIIFILGMAVSVVNITVRVIMYKLIPNKIKGKIFGTLSTFCTIINPISLILSGIVIAKINPFILSISSGILFIILTLVLSSNKHLKTL
ncbi:hypothetical protein C3495_05355 [Clostridiaceae bacterium 14S0207]|nr:hypothetical protein C3495_05355 [Clostridiaceae bacterium 14S0207]